MTGFCPVSFAILKQKEEETMAFDFKKEFREFYLPPQKPQGVTLSPELMQLIGSIQHMDSETLLLLGLLWLL